MPRYPTASSTVATMPAGVFSKLAHRIAEIEGERFQLAVGDTYLAPAQGCRMSDFDIERNPGMNTYAPPRGLPVLLDAISTSRGVDADRVIVTAGATGGLGALMGAWVDPGEEVLILSPFWPLIRGIVTLHHGVTVEVPTLGLHGAEAFVAALEEKVSTKTVAVYINTPNNPTGRVYKAAVMAGIAAFARRHELWIFSDEVYENIVFSGEHIGMASLAPERTFSVYSFSKAYGMAGNRVGYIVGPSKLVMATVRKATVHHFYGASTAGQMAAAAVLKVGSPWIADAVKRYQCAGEAAAEALGLTAPQGGTFLFIDVSHRLDDRGLEGFLIDCIEKGLILAPGPACGEDYPHHVRLCFTAAPPDVVGRGVGVLKRLLS